MKKKTCRQNNGGNFHETKIVSAIILTAVLCFSIVGCSKIRESLSSQNSAAEVRDMDWYYKNKGYAIMRVADTRNKPVMEIIAIPLNSKAILALVHEDVEDVNRYLQARLRHQNPVIYLSVYAHRDCIFFWPSLKIQQGAGFAVPTSVLPSESGLIAAAGRLFDRYGERRVREVDTYIGFFTNLYTGRNRFELEKEIELAQGETLTAVAIFSGGLKLERPFYLICKSQRHVTSSVSTYTTREVKKLIKMYGVTKY